MLHRLVRKKEAYGTEKKTVSGLGALHAIIVFTMDSFRHGQCIFRRARNVLRI
jgi:hypothetical protein